MKLNEEISVVYKDRIWIFTTIINGEPREFKHPEWNGAVEKLKEAKEAAANTGGKAA